MLGKRVFRIFSFILICFSMSLPVFGAEAVYVNEETGYGVFIEDNYDILTDSEEKTLTEIMERTTDFGNAVLLTEPEVHDADIYPEKYYLAHHGAYESGVVFYIDPEMLYIYSEGSAYDSLGSQWADTIADNVYKLCNPGTYLDCCVKAFGQINDVLAGKRVPAPMKLACNIILGLLISFFATYLIVNRRSRLSATADSELIKAGKAACEVSGVTASFINQTRIYSPRSRSSGHHGGGHHGGGHHGGGGGHRH